MYKRVSIVWDYWGRDYWGQTPVRKRQDSKRVQISEGLQPNLEILPEKEVENLDFSDVKGQEELINAVVLAAAGGHNLLMVGEPACCPIDIR